MKERTFLYKRELVFDHMLTLFARHGRFGLQVEAEGDVFVDAHHTVEDVGIVLGNCLKEALQNKEGLTVTARHMCRWTNL